MDKTEGMITENHGDYKVEKMLFTYNENEMQENRFNKFVVEQEKKGWSYFVIEQQQLALGFSEAEAIMFNFVDGYTKSGKYFWYSTQDICEKTYWGKDKVINTIKSLVKKGYVIREKGKDRFGNERRFLSTTTKYSLELLKLRGVSENQIGGIGKSDRGISEKPTHSIIYSNINSNKINIENQKQENTNSFPKQDIADDAHHSGCDLTNYNFDMFWKEFPHARKGKKKESEQYFNRQDAELVKKQVGILNFKINAGLQDAQFIPACERRIRDFTPISDIVLKQELLKIAKWHLNAGGDIKARAKQLKETFGENAINEAVKTIQQKESPKNLFLNK